MTPYTYLIGWLHLNTFYYGVRYRPGCQPSDLWVKYFTSSKEVKAFRKEHGEPTLVEVRRIFSSPDEARLWEHKVLRRLNVRQRSDFLNITTSRAPSMLGKKHGEETLKKMSAWQKGKKKPIDTVLKMRASLTGRKLSDEARAAISAGHQGIQFSETHKANIAASKVGRKHWTNGTEYRCCHIQPGPEWFLGKRKKKRGPEGPHVFQPE